LNGGLAAFQLRTHPIQNHFLAIRMRLIAMNLKPATVDEKTPKMGLFSSMSPWFDFFTTASPKKQAAQ
jgi:hypothetical protein